MKRSCQVVWGAAALMLSVGTLVPSQAVAQVGTCVSNTNASDIRPVRVNFQGFSGAMPKVTLEEVRVSVLHSISQWTESAAGAGFVFEGSTSCTALDWAGGCCDSNIVTFMSVCPTGWARANTLAAGCNGTRSHVVVCGQIGAGGTPIDWDVNSVSSTEFDLTSSVTHEFGHTIGVNHPNNGETATMGGANAGDVFRRQLYYYDVDCSEDGANGYREMRSYRRTQISSGSFGSEWSQAYYYDDFSNHDVERYTNGSSTSRGFLWREEDEFKFRRSGTTTPIRSFPALGLGSEVALSSYSESSDGPLRMFWTTPATGDRYIQAGRSHVNVRWTDDEFATSSTFPLYECSSMTGWFQCAFLAYLPVTSAYRPQTAYDSYSQRTVSVWSHQGRLNGGAGDNAVRISFGEILPWLLPPSTDLPGAQTLVSPGIACESFEATGTNGSQYDCIVAFADRDSNDSRIRVGRFFGLNAGGTHVVPSFDPGFTTVDIVDAETTFGITAWYASLTDRWYLAFLATDTGQPVRVYESTDSLTWSHVGDYGTSYLAPRIDRRDGVGAYLYSVH